MGLLKVGRDCSLRIMVVFVGYWSLGTSWVCMCVFYISWQGCSSDLCQLPSGSLHILVNCFIFVGSARTIWSSLSCSASPWVCAGIPAEVRLGEDPAMLEKVRYRRPLQWEDSGCQNSKTATGYLCCEAFRSIRLWECVGKDTEEEFHSPYNLSTVTHQRRKLFKSFVSHSLFLEEDIL